MEPADLDPLPSRVPRCKRIGGACVAEHWNQSVPDIVRDLAPISAADPGNRNRRDEMLRMSTLLAPKLTIQGGTREILRGIIARDLGVISQSGGIGFSFYDRGHPRWLPFSYVVSTGNEAGVSIVDALIVKRKNR